MISSGYAAFKTRPANDNLCRLNTVKSHKTNLLTKERDLASREAALLERETKLAAIVAQKDEELASLRNVLANAESTLHQRVRQAVSKRDEELRAMLLKQEQEVTDRMTRREQEIMEAVRRREEEMARMWGEWEQQTRESMGRAVEERMQWVQQRGEELEHERQRLDGVKQELETKVKAMEAAASGERRTRSKNPLEEVKNIMAPLSRLADSPEPVKVSPPQAYTLPEFKTPMPTKSANVVGADLVPHSAMKGVILTATGEPVATPTQAELAKLFVETPKVGLNFAKIFDFDAEDESGDSDGELDEDGYETDSRPRACKREKDRDSSDGESTPTQSTASTSSATSATLTVAPAVKPTRLRRPSIRASSASAVLRPVVAPEPAAPTSSSARTRMKRAASSPTVASSSAAPPQAQPPASGASKTATSSEVASLAQAPEPKYDFNDVENLPSPFIKKVSEDRVAAASAPAAKARTGPRKSGTTLRAMAAMNAAKGAPRPPSSASMGNLAGAAGSASASGSGVRSSIAKAQKAHEEARKALSARS